MSRHFCISILLWIVVLLFCAEQSFALHTRTPYRPTYRAVARKPAAIKANKPGKRARVRRAAKKVVAWAPVLKGSHDSLLRQNEEIDRLQLPRIANDEELLALEQRSELVQIRNTQALIVSSSLEDTRKYCRPWTLSFLRDLSAAFYKEFHQPLEVTSAVRTVEQQARLRRTNHNAAPIEGETASSHLAGLTIDIGKKGMSRRQIKWIDDYLVDMQEKHIIEAAEERRQACFHIMVSAQYMEYREQKQFAAAKR